MIPSPFIAVTRENSFFCAKLSVFCSESLHPVVPTVILYSSEERKPVVCEDFLDIRALIVAGLDCDDPLRPGQIRSDACSNGAIGFKPIFTAIERQDRIMLSHFRVQSGDHA